MAYPKVNVNTLTGVRVVKSDTVNIPNSSLLISGGTTTAAVTGFLFDLNVCTLGANGTTTATTANKLVDVGAAFITGQISGGTPSYFPPVVIKNYVYNTTDSVASHVTSVDSETILGLNGDIMSGSELYNIYNEGFNQRLHVKIGDLVINTTDNTLAFVTGILNDAQISLSVDIMDNSESYQIYNQDAADLTAFSNEGFLIYVGSTASITQDIQPTDPVQPGVGVADPRYVDVKVLTVNNQEITFENFKVGECLPVQCKRIFTTGTSAAVDCIAMS